MTRRSAAPTHRDPARLQGDAGTALSNGVRTIVVETANRFARDLMVQEVGYAMLKERGIELIAADRPDAFLDDTPTSTMIRQILGVVSQFEKAMLVVKLRGARERKTRDRRKWRAARSHAEKRPEVVALAKQLHREQCRCANLGRAVRRWPRQQERQAVHAAVDRQHAGRLTRRWFAATWRAALRRFFVRLLVIQWWVFRRKASQPSRGETQNPISFAEQHGICIAVFVRSRLYYRLDRLPAAPVAD